MQVVTESAYDRLLQVFYDVDAISSAMSLMNWDKQVLMPPGGAEARTAQLVRLGAMSHILTASDQTRRLLEEAEGEAEPDSAEAAMLRNVRRSVDLECKLPTSLVERKARASSAGHEAWKRAKAEAKFSILSPHLEELFEIARETSHFIDPQRPPYDNLIDLFEEGATTADATAMFESIKAPIVALVAEITERGKPVDDSPLAKDWDSARLRGVAETMCKHIGFDFGAGRLDLAPNAFCATVSTRDIRMTTRASEHFKGVISSSLHEMGHALYELNSPPDWDRTPLRGGISNAVHESQSQLWENIVGRSKPFWSHFLPMVHAAMPELPKLGADGFYRCMNKVKPEFLRVGADELTYNLHILVRFELEVELIERKLAVADLSDAWNAKYKEYLGVEPPNDAAGCLQDVHWSRGSVGYFPTYAMGNMIGAQIWEKLSEEVKDVDGRIEAGDFAAILSWLTFHVYSQARRYRPRDLVARITGRPMETGPWLAYANRKYRGIYEL